MTSKSQKRRDRRIALSKLDSSEQAYGRQGDAINYMIKNTVKVPRLNKFYTCDGFKFGTGKKHRKMG